MTEFWLVRHGQTDWNIERRFQGRTDIPLNETGITQAHTLAQTLTGQTFAAIYSSPLQRALQTAQVLSEHLQLPIQIEPGLVESAHGDWEGMCLEDIKAQYPELIQARRQNPLENRPPGNAESIPEVAARMAAAANSIAQHHPQERVLITSHGLALAALICQARQISLNEIFNLVPSNTQVEKIVWGRMQTPGLE
jgi:broad specificity phosphatase PhoE